MSLQTIIDRAESIKIDHRRIVAATVTRNQKLLTATRSSLQPWQFSVTPTNGYRWDENNNRSVIAAIENIDRHTETTISLSNNPGMEWLTEYQGDLNPSQLSDMTINSFSGTTLVLNLGSSVQALSTGTVLFQAGDIIQPANSNYPYVVANTVTRGSGTTRTIITHRPLVPEAVSVTGQQLDVGVDCTWRVKIVALPTYTIAPGRFITWSGAFELLEYID